MEIKNSEGPATIFVRSFNFTHIYQTGSYQYNSHLIGKLSTK